jgi:D-glycero-alpha-D-manno-heptose-7-phosphate kinase
VARAAAPVRLDFAGGWTDVPPFSTREGGVVVNAAMNLFVRAEAAHSASGFHLVAGELGAEMRVAAIAESVPDPRLVLHAAALRHCRPASPVSLSTTSDVPPGSGLGSSGALDVALVASLAALEGHRLGPLALAHSAWQLEAVEAGVPGGKQDQYAAAVGGFNVMSFRDPDVGVTSLEIDPVFAAELARHIVLCYTGASHLSGNTIARVMAAFEAGNLLVAGALHELKDVALEMADAMRRADVARVGALLTRNWQAQQRLDAGMCTPGMAQLEDAALAAGALGGKAAGSGAGGCMFFLAGRDVAAVRDAAVAQGARLLPVEWAWTGVRPCGAGSC